VDLQSAATDPLMALSVDANTPSIGFDLDLGPTRIEMPFNAFDPESPSTDPLVIDWQGASFSMIVDDDNESISVTNIGIGNGESLISLGAKKLLGFELNRELEHRVDVEVGHGEHGTTMTMDPGLTFDIFVDVEGVEGFESSTPALHGVTYSAALTGASPTIEIYDADFESITRVNSGALTLSSSTGESVTIPAGQCIGDVLDPATDSPVDGIQAIECPVPPI